ncbi:sulfotransferase family protein [Bacillus oleivorans]|uniref:Sulfotransferase family protein n=1 Tax=Bacillus oleivorans TaxID=1448271 RepID=A0A285D4Y6_9BACI|nr:sulfotransferase family 2 domain-containing protein [Bacillus oleivorans]SNX74864.1 sulfotransferase family protein [Bacillus oleivorans]
MTNSNEILIHLHIAKTGGTTFISILEKNYLPTERIPIYLDPIVNKNEYIKSRLHENIKCMYGHTSFGIHQTLSMPVTYTTFLRDPIDRVISEYYFNHYRPNDTNKDSLRFNSLEEFADHPDFCNHQSKILFGKPPLPKNAFEYIQQNINKYFSFIGITELYDESVFLMNKQFGWNNINYIKENVTLNRPKKEDIPKSLLKKIEQNNHLDFAIYHYAKYLLLNKLEELNQNEKMELNDFKSKINELNSNNG